MLWRRSTERNHLSAFTLIELLVVISIIALLIAILLPALGAARDSARAAVCLSDQRQIGLSMYNYANDSRDYLVPSRLHRDYTTLPSMHRAVPTDDDHMKFAWPLLLRHLGYMSGTSDWQVNSGWESFACAAAPNEFGPGSYDHPGWHTYYISFGYNWEEIGASIGILPNTDTARWYTPARLDQIVDASQKLLLTDTVSTAGNGAAPSTPPRGYNRVATDDGSSVEGRPDPRHRGAINIVWADGHGSSVRSPDPADYNAIYDVLGEGGQYGTASNVWGRKNPGKSVD